jgi:carbonic anhydrase/acetyltransferase-like protein (isoleucine patch superfamily)
MRWYDVRLDAVRDSAGFLGVAQVIALADNGVMVYDPFSVLISRGVLIGKGCVLYPMVTIECDGRSTCTLGAGNTLLSGTRIVAEAGGHVTIGARNLIGEGGAQVKANRPGTSIVIGNQSRITGGAEITGTCMIGDGCQVIGAVMAQSVRLDGGQSWTHPDPDARGAVLKGRGLARGLHLRTGEVINGNGDFSSAPVERQAAYHPKTGQQ